MVSRKPTLGVSIDRVGLFILPVSSVFLDSYRRRVNGDKVLSGNGRLVHGVEAKSLINFKDNKP